MKEVRFIRRSNGGFDLPVCSLILEKGDSCSNELQLQRRKFTNNTVLHLSSSRLRHPTQVAIPINLKPLYSVLGQANILQTSLILAYHILHTPKVLFRLAITAREFLPSLGLDVRPEGVVLILEDVGPEEAEEKLGRAVMFLSDCVDAVVDGASSFRGLGEVFPDCWVVV